MLDPALLRPGRFDRQVDARPARTSRAARRSWRSTPAASRWTRTSRSTTLAKQTPGFSGADLENLVNEAAILAARRNRKTIGMDELDEAIDRVIAGPERKSRVITRAREG